MSPPGNTPRHSPLQNRVMPTGEIVATPHRGTVMGNRGGCFHRVDRSLKTRQWASRQWICCVLAFKGRRRALMQPGLYTELFFLDEATALAAGHRPCFECRRGDANRFRSLWAETVGKGLAPRAGDMDDVLHSERMTSPDRRPMPALADLPDGSFVWQDRAYLVVDGRARAWSFDGYGPPAQLSKTAPLRLLTPPSTLAILTAGYLPMLHRTVSAPGG